MESVLWITAALAMLSSMAFGRGIFYEERLSEADADYSELFLPEVVSNHPAGIFKHRNNSRNFVNPLKIPVVYQPRRIPYNGTVPKIDYGRPNADATQQVVPHQLGQALTNSSEIMNMQQAPTKRQPETGRPQLPTRKPSASRKPTPEVTTEETDDYEKMITLRRRTGYRKLPKSTITTSGPHDEYEECECDCEEEEEEVTRPTTKTPKRIYERIRKSTARYRSYRKTTAPPVYEDETGCSCR